MRRRRRSAVGEGRLTAQCMEDERTPVKKNEEAIRNNNKNNILLDVPQFPLVFLVRFVFVLCMGLGSTCLLSVRARDDD